MRKLNELVQKSNNVILKKEMFEGFPVNALSITVNYANDKKLTTVITNEALQDEAFVENEIQRMINKIS